MVIFHPFKRESIDDVSNGCRDQGIPLVCCALGKAQDKVLINEDSNFIRCACINATGWFS